MNLYLSRLVLNPRSWQVLSELADPYEMHRTIMRAFPQKNDATSCEAREEFGVLFRADVDDLKGSIKVYIQSRVKPNWSYLDDLKDYLYTDSGLPAHEFKDISPSLCRIKNGQIFSFRLRANPTKRIGKDGNIMKGKRVGLLREEEQIGWLVRKSRNSNKASTGFELLMDKVEDEGGTTTLTPSVNVICKDIQTCRRKNRGQLQRTTHQAVCFEGLLQVTDADAFRETLTMGIGPGKAFGFGLLTVVPIHRSGQCG